MFTRSRDDDAKLTMIRNEVPIIIFKPEVLIAQEVVVDICKQEVSWLGMVNKPAPNVYVIEEIFVPTQGVDATNCEILARGYVDIENEMTRRGTFDRMFNDLKFWGHSHVNMGVGPSGDDRRSAIKRCQDAGDYYIRCICNKEGRMHLSFFDNVKGIAYENIDWRVDDGIDHDSIRNKYSTLVKENVLDWDVAFPKPVSQSIAPPLNTGGPDNLRLFTEVPGRPTDADNWPIINVGNKKSKSVRRRSQVMETV